jgi:hypothetical protein
MTVMSNPKRQANLFSFGWMDGWIVSQAFLSLQPIILSADSSSPAAEEEKNNEKKGHVFISYH